MSLIIGDGGGLEVGPGDGDPLREAHALILRKLAVKFELDQQWMESADSLLMDARRRVAELEATVATLEALMIGDAA